MPDTEQPVVVTDDNFVAEVTNAEGPVVVEFWTQGCGPCRMVRGGLERIWERDRDRFTLAFGDVADLPERVAEVGVRTAPTLVIYRDGAVLAQRSGALIESQLSSWLDEHLTATT